MPNADQQYWDAVRTGEREEEPWPVPQSPCREWQCKGSHEECAKAGKCLMTAVVMEAAPAVPAAGVVWPKHDRVERRDDMSATGKLTVLLQRDGDVVVNVCSGETAADWESATVEFCAGGGGGGRSMRTREALIALMVAMEADNAERPMLSAAPGSDGGAPSAGGQHGR